MRCEAVLLLLLICLRHLLVLRLILYEKAIAHRKMASLKLIVMGERLQRDLNSLLKPPRNRLAVLVTHLQVGRRVMAMAAGRPTVSGSVRLGERDELVGVGGE